MRCEGSSVASEDLVPSESPHPYIVLGLDIGIASIGWCLLDIESHRIVDMGVRLWESVQEDKTKASKAATRRTARGQRRRIARCRDRKARCLVLLKAHGLLPADATPASLQKTAEDELSMLQARAAALDTLLTDRQLSQVLYGICKRRGYIPHGAEAQDTDGRKILSALEANGEKLEDGGYRTVGEMMLREGEAAGKPCGTSRNHGGDYSRCVSMKDLMHEVDAIFDAQRSLGNPKATSELQASFKACMSWEKGTESADERSYALVGRCVYGLTDADGAPLKRAARSCPSFERCAAYERLANVRVVYPGGRSEQLPAEARQWAMGVLFSPVPVKGNKACRITYSKLRDHLDLPAAACFKGVPGDREAKLEVCEPKVWRSMCKHLPAELMQRLAGDRELADAVGSALAYASSAESLRSRLEQLVPGSLAEPEVAALCSLPYSTALFSGYGSRSVDALQMLCDAFEDFESIGSLTEAEQACGLYGKSVEPSGDLGAELPPYSDFDPGCTNPVVLRAMAQVRRVVNAVVREHGIPDEVHIELARELKIPKSARVKIERANKKRAERRENARSVLAELRGCAPEAVPNRLADKYLYWLEQGGFDVYSGEPIRLERLAVEEDYCEVDHILTWSRTCDDSRSNKVLALDKSNQEKLNRTPFEWFGGDEGRWAAFEQRVLSMREHGYPPRKAANLLCRDLSEAQDDFIARNLNDTRYASRAAKAYIEAHLAFPVDAVRPGSSEPTKQHVLAVAGGATAVLRHSWGIYKDRSTDDLHHAVDAAVIAACGAAAVQRVARYHEGKRYVSAGERDKMLASLEPWPGFANEAVERANRVIPTRKPEHGLSARLFEDTLYSYKGLNTEGTLGLLTAAGKVKKSSNYIVRDDGSAVLPDGLAFLRLWWNPEAKVRGRKTPGAYLAEPVYYADLPAALGEGWAPKYVPPQSDKKPRCAWDAVPERAMEAEPVVLFPGDALIVKGKLRRFKGVDISVCSWSLSDPTGRLSDMEATKGLSFSKIGDPGDLVLIAEDVLGRCFDDMDTSAAS